MAPSADIASKTVVVVTGSNRGIGLELVRALTAAQSGPYHVFLCGRTADKASAAVESLGASLHGHSVSALALDVTSRASIAAAAASVAASAGRVDVLVSNAGVIDHGDDPVARLEASLATNVVGPFALVHAFTPLLKAAGPATKRVVHVTSDLGSVAARLDPANKLYGSAAFEEYRVSKAALNMVSACNAFALREDGVAVLAFNPGFTATDLTGSAEERRKRGARDPAVVAKAMLDVVEGKRDGDRAHMLDVEGVLPW